MDAFTLYAFGFTGLLWGAAGFLVGRAQRELRYRRDAAANLARANDRTNQRRNARAYANRVTVSDLGPNHLTDTGTDSDRNANDHNPGTDSGVHQARRRSVHRDHNRHRALALAPDGGSDRTNEAALAS